MSTTAPSMTAEDLLALPDAERFELVDGQLIARPMSLDSSWVSGEIFGRLREYGNKDGHGWAFPDGTSYQCFQEDREQVRRPDASYILRSRLPHGRTDQGHCRVCPDLAVEVISPGDVYYDIELKIEEYLAAGVKQVWIVSPNSRHVVIHQQGKAPSHLLEGDVLSGGELLPGFSCPVAQLFPPWSRPFAWTPEA